MFLSSVFLSCIASFQFGTQTGIIASALLYLPHSFPELKNSPYISSMIVASLLLGALFGSFAFSKVADFYGRKIAIFILHSIIVIVSILIYFSVSLVMIIILRFFIGLSVGGCAVIVPVYLAEISPPNIRGKVGSYIQFSIAFGNISSYLLGYVISFLGQESWRLMFSLPGAFSLIPLLFFGFMVESPRFLVQNNKELEAKESLETMGFDDEEIEYQIILMEKTLSDSFAKSKNSWYKLIFDYKKPLFLAMGTYAIQQFSGINVFVYYSGIIFESIGFNKQQSLLASFVSAAPQLLMIFASSFYLDRLGRKFPFILSAFAMGSVIIVFACSSLLQKVYQQWISIVALLLARLAFSGGLGVVPHIFAAEILPNRFRAKGMALSSATNWICNGLITFTFPPLLNVEKITLNTSQALYIYLLYGIFNFVSCFVIFVFYTETKQTVIDELEDFETLNESSSLLDDYD